MYKTKIEKLRRALNNPPFEVQHTITDGYRFIVYPVRLLIQVWRQLIAHKCLQQASALAFTTVLSLVPLFAMAFFILNAFSAFEGTDSKIIQYIQVNFLPEYEAQAIAEAIKEFTEAINIGALGLVAFIPLLLFAMGLFQAIESIFNDIWNARNSRPFFQKLAVFYTVITISPILVGLSIYQAEHWQVLLETHEGGLFLLQIIARILPFMTLWLALVLAYKLIPNTAVRWRPVMLSALIAGILLEIMKNGFSWYLTVISGRGYKAIYDAIMFIPIFAVWSYTAWVVVLFGTELAHALQNLRNQHLSLALSAVNPVLTRERIIFVNALLVVRFFLMVAEHYRWKGGALSSSQIALRFGISEEVVERIFKQFKEAGLILEVAGDTNGYLPARPLEQISIEEVVDAFEGRMELLASLPGEDTSHLEILAQQLRASRAAVMGKRTIESLFKETTHEENHLHQ